MNWERAACRTVDVDRFFPYDDNEWAVSHASDALRVCATCPVKGPCGLWATLNGIEDGIWGGLTPTDRRRLAAARDDLRHEVAV